MRVRLDEGERYPSLRIEVEELAVDDPKAEQMPNVTPVLINAWQKAERELQKAEQAILEHLSETEQFRIIAYDALGRNSTLLRDHTMFYSLEASVVERWLSDLEEML